MIIHENAKFTCGSARKDGNTAILINIVFEEMHRTGIETEMVQLSRKIIEPCKACWACDGRKNCVQGKDMFQEIFEKMTQADGIILGSPVYTANISANMQAFLERASVVTDMNRGEDLFQHKVGAAVTAARRGVTFFCDDFCFGACGQPSVSEKQEEMQSAVSKTDE